MAPTLSADTYAATFAANYQITQNFGTSFCFTVMQKKSRIALVQLSTATKGNRMKSLKRMLARKKAIQKRLDKNDDYIALKLLEKEIEWMMEPHREKAKTDYTKKGIKTNKKPIAIGDMFYNYKAFTKSFPTARFTAIKED